MNLTQGKNHSDSRRKSQRRTWHKKQRSLKNLTQFKKALETQVEKDMEDLIQEKWLQKNLKHNYKRPYKNLNQLEKALEESNTIRKGLRRI